MPTITLNSPEIQHLAERDFRLRHLMQHIGDLEYSRPESAFHSLVHSIIEQMLSMKIGNAIQSRLLACCDGDFNPERIQSLSIEEIKGCGMSMRKAQSIHALAEYALEHDLEALNEADDEEVRSTLLKLPGIGKWTCDMFLLFYLERPDILPIEDGALRQAFAWLYDVPITSSEAQRLICSLWRPYSSIAVRYLYRALNAGIVKEAVSPIRMWEAD